MQTPLRILLVVDSLEPGGAERHVTDLALSLHAAGHHVVVVCAVGGPFLADLESAGISVRVLGTRLVKRRIDLIYAWRLRAVLRNERVDLVHAHLYASAAAASLAAFSTRSVLLITVHSEGAWQGAFARRLSWCVYRGADALIAVSQPIAQQLTDRCGVSAPRVNVIANALLASPPASTTENRSLAAAGPVVGVIARLHPEKGVDVFLDAMSRILPHHPAVRSMVIGDGPLRDRLLRQAHALGLDGHVQFHGCRTDARQLIPTFDLLVLPSRSEGSPLVVLEAMAAGVAVVASRVGGIPDQIRHGLDGLLVPPNSPAALAGAINLLLTNHAWRRRLAAEGQRHVVRHFPYSVVLHRHEEVYSAALENTVGQETIHILSSRP